MAERVYFDSPRARITSTSARFGATTYPLGGITSVRQKAIPAQTGMGVLAVLVGVIALLCSGVWTWSDLQQGGQMLGVAFVGAIGGVVMLMLGGMVFASQRPSYQIVIGTAGGERSGLTSDDPDLVSQVASALEEALADRSGSAH